MDTSTAFSIFLGMIIGSFGLVALVVYLFKER